MPDVHLDDRQTQLNIRIRTTKIGNYRSTSKSFIHYLYRSVFFSITIFPSFPSRCMSSIFLLPTM